MKNKKLSTIFVIVAFLVISTFATGLTYNGESGIWTKFDNFIRPKSSVSQNVNLTGNLTADNFFGNGSQMTDVIHSDYTAYTGSDLSDVDGVNGRTLTFTNAPTLIYLDGMFLEPTIDWSKSGSTITFIVNVFNSQKITIYD